MSGLPNPVRSDRRLLNFTMDRPELCSALLMLLEAGVTSEFYEDFSAARLRWRKECAADKERGL